MSNLTMSAAVMEDNYTTMPVEEEMEEDLGSVESQHGEISNFDTDINNFFVFKNTTSNPPQIDK